MKGVFNGSEETGNLGKKKKVGNLAKFYHKR